jgi:conjugal transfer pilus assembly protein TraE
MRTGFYKSELAKLIEQRNGYMVLAAGLIVLSIILGLLVFHLAGREKVIIAPPVLNKSFWVTNSEVSEEYLSEMSLFFVYMRLNVTPDNSQYQHEVLLRFADPKYHGSFKSQLVSERDYLGEEHLTTAFYPTKVSVDTKRLKVVITGELHTTVVNEPLTSQTAVYEVLYNYNHGRLLIKSFVEVNKHAEN